MSSQTTSPSWSKLLSDCLMLPQNLRLRAQKYSYYLFWKPGKNLLPADAMSRAPGDDPTEAEIIHYVIAHHVGGKRMHKYEAPLPQTMLLSASARPSWKGGHN